MKIHIGVSLVVISIIYSVAGITDELRKKSTEAQLECKKEVGLTDEEFKDYTTRSKLPLTDGGKCCPMCACFMNKIGYMTNGRLNLMNMIEINKQKWDNPKYVEEAIKIDVYCIQNVKTDGKKECEIALEYKTCKTKKVEEIGDLPPPS